MSGERILVVEDSVITSRQIAAALKKMGYIVAAIVDTGEDAIKKAYMLKPDLVLSDIILKGKMTGIESAKEIRDNLRIPVVFLTAHSGDDLLEKAVTAEPFGYLLKPLDERTLKSTIGMALYNHAMGVKLNESQQKLTGILNNITDVIWSLSWPDMTVQYISPSVEKMYRRTLQEFIDTPSLWSDVTHPDDKQITENALEQLQKDGSADRVCRIIRPDGSIVWIHEKSHLIFDEHGTPLRVEGITSDITGRKRAEEALAAKTLQLERMNEQLTATEQELRASIEELEKGERTLKESKEQLALAMEGSGVGLWDWHVQIGKTVFNERWAEIAGYTLAELSPVSIDTWINLCHPDDLQQSDERLKKHFKKESPSYECEVRIRHKDGHWVRVLDRGKVVTWDSEGLPIRMTGTHVDITDITGIAIRKTSEPGKGAQFGMTVPQGELPVSEREGGV